MGHKLTYVLTIGNSFVILFIDNNIDGQYSVTCILPKETNLALKQPKKRKLMCSHKIEEELYLQFKAVCDEDGLSYSDGLHNAITTLLEQRRIGLEEHGGAGDDPHAGDEYRKDYDGEEEEKGGFEFK